MHTVNLLSHLIENYQLLVYLFIFLGLIIEGEFVLIAIGIFFHLHTLNVPLAFTLIVLGLFSKTMFGYYLGGLVHQKWNHTKFLKYIERRVSTVMPHFKEEPFWSIFISKFILGTNNIVIIFSGYTKIDLKKYLKAEFFSTIIWAPLLVLLGYFFSYTAFSMSREIWRFSFLILIFIVLFITIDKLISWVYEVFEEFHDHKK